MVGRTQHNQINLERLGGFGRVEGLVGFEGFKNQDTVQVVQIVNHRGGSAWFGSVQRSEYGMGGPDC